MDGLGISNEQRIAFDGFADVLRAASVTNLRFHYRGAYGEDWDSEELVSTNGVDYFSATECDDEVENISTNMSEFFWEILPELHPDWDQYAGSSGFFDWDLLERRCHNKHRWDNGEEMSCRSQFIAGEVGVEGQKLKVRISDLHLNAVFFDEEEDVSRGEWQSEGRLRQLLSEEISRVSVYIVGLGDDDFAETIIFENDELIIQVGKAQSLDYLDQLEAVFVSVDLDFGEVWPEVGFKL